MYCRRARAALLFALAAVACSCAKPEFTHRVAVLRFEDLSSTLENNWVGRAIAEEVAGQLEGTRHHAVVPLTAIRRVQRELGRSTDAVPGESAELTASEAAGANRLISGYYVLDGNHISLTALEENVDGRKSRLLLREEGAFEDLLHLADQIAHREDEEARPPITGSARALRAYAVGLDSPADQAAASFEQAVRLDPDFGAPYVSLAQLALSRHDLDGFRAILESVRARSGVRAQDRALLNLDDARLRGDPATTLDALAALVRVSPADPFRVRELADADLAGNRFPEAADNYRKLAALTPADPEPENLLGYALMYAGDEAGSTKAFTEYRRASRDSANALDSSGDGQFFFRRFDDAEKWYLAAYSKNPNGIEGAELIKAAWCRLMKADIAGASNFVNRFLADRGRAGDATAPLKAAQIWRVAGQPQQAERAVAAYEGSDVPAVRTGATQELAWWRFLDGPGAPPDEHSPLGPAVAAIQAKDFKTAVVRWHSLAEVASPADWWIRTVYGRCLNETGQTQEARRYLEHPPLPNPGRSVSLDELWYPYIIGKR